MLNNSSSLSFSPSLIFLETTKACDYACRHCRADSRTLPESDELSTTEIIDLIKEIEQIWPYHPEIIFTGGNALMRPDLKELVSFTARKRFPFSLAPSASDRLTDDMLSFLKSMGVRSISLSLDGIYGGTHDWLRNKAGSFQKTLELLQRVRNHGIPAQINTIVMEGNFMELPSVASLVKDSGVRIWELFFLISSGRAERCLEISPPAYMGVNLWLSGLWKYGLFVRTVESPVFRVIRKISENNPGSIDLEVYRVLQEMTGSLLDEDTTLKPGRGVASAGRKFGGTLFFSSTGEVYPSGLFNYRLGRIRDSSLKDIVSGGLPYLNARTSGLIKGKCGKCEFLEICGGSRARALSHYGDPFQEDPLCTYHPELSERGAMHAVN